MKKIIFGFLLALLFIGCKSKADLNYMQDIEALSTEVSLKNSQSTIQVGDELSVVVSARDLDVVRPFNQNYSSGQVVQPENPGGNVSARPISESTPRYIVDNDGIINFPVIGNVSTVGLTTSELRSELERKISRYVLNPTVQVKYVNYKVVVLGEVNKPGTYYVPDGNATILSALGLAGDLTMYGRRNDVLIVRNINGEITKTRIDLTRADFINSPYYTLRQNDVLYVSANETKQKTSQLDPNAGIYISVASIAVTILALLFK